MSTEEAIWASFWRSPRVEAIAAWALAGPCRFFALRPARMRRGGMRHRTRRPLALGFCGLLAGLGCSGGTQAGPAAEEASAEAAHTPNTAESRAQRARQAELARRASLAEEERRQAEARAAATRSAADAAARAQAAEEARLAAIEEAQRRADEAERRRLERERLAFERAYPLHGVANHFLARVYARTRKDSKVVGYMRRGSRFRASERQPGSGCRAGWYKVPGGGYVCRGEGFALGREPQSFEPSPRPPALEDAMPYLYAFATRDDVPQFWGLPSREQEGAVRRQLDAMSAAEEAARQAAARAPTPPRVLAAPETPQPAAAVADDNPGEADENAANAADAEEAAPAVATEDEAGGESAVEAPPPPGSSEADADEMVAPQEEQDAAAAEPDAGPGELPSFVRMRMRQGFYVSLDGEERVGGRRWYRTIRGAYVRASHTRLSEPPSNRGVLMGGDWQLPVAFVYARGAHRIERRRSDGRLMDRGVATVGHAIAVTETTRYRRREYVVGHDGNMFRSTAVRTASRVDRPDEIGAEDRWIHVDLSEQVLVAYEGNEPVFATLVSTGQAGFETPLGVFRIQSKHVSTTMDNLANPDESYSIEDVPWTMYFRGNYALHGAFWHGHFGRVRSHGCVNLAPVDARWLFQWSTPNVPDSWHGRFSTRRNPGTFVYITE